MPLKSPKPPPVVTWGEATPPLVLAGVFDALIAMLWFFGLFGPAIVGAVTKSTTVQVALFVFGGAQLQAFGMIMAMIISLLGFMVLRVLLFKHAVPHELVSLKLGVALFIHEIPFVGAVPAFSPTVWFIYKNRIKKSTQALAKHHEEEARSVRSRAYQFSIDQQAANDEIPEDEQRAA